MLCESNRIETGELRFRHPKFLGSSFGSVESVIQEGKRKEIEILAEEVIRCDTRMSLTQILGKLDEGHVWDEYLHVSTDMRYSENCENPPMWPTSYRWIEVSVVTGGSEGLYLHVNAVDSKGERTSIFLGKTLNCGYDKWIECYLSAGRIAWRLGA
jgi:hypothetical protein